MKNVYKLVANQNSLWVTWVNRVKLKGRSFWTVNSGNNDSGTWKALLDLRMRVRKHIIHQIGDGKSTYMWHDNWSHFGQLSCYVTEQNLHEVRIDSESKV